MKKTAPSKTLYHLITSIVIALVVGEALLAALTVLPNVIGLDFSMIHAGSPESTFPSGDIAVTREVDPATLGVGDLVAYSSGSQLITDRITRTGETKSGRFFYMRESFNDADALPVIDSMVMGEVVYTIPHVGYLVPLANSTTGMTLLILTPGLILLLYWIREQQLKRVLVRQGMSVSVVRNDTASQVISWAADRDITNALARETRMGTKASGS